MIRRNRPPVDSVLFLQSATEFHADAQVHASFASLLPAQGFAVFAACHPGIGGTASPCLQAFRAIPDVTTRSTRFGPTFERTSRLGGAASLALSIPSIVKSIVGLSWFVRRHRIGVIHCSEKMRETMIGFAVARISGARLAVHLHVKPADWFSAPTRWVMHRADRLIAISQFVAEAAVGMGYRPEQVVVVMNGLTFAIGDLTPHADDREWLETEFDVPPGVPVICCAARVNRYKGHRELLESLAQVHRAGTEFFLLAAGRNDESETDPEFTIEALRRYADELGIGERVTFTGFRKDGIRLIRAGEIFAMTSGEEPFGLVYVEAMAAGRPVVALATGGTPEVVVDRVTGLLSEYGDEPALTANLQALLQDANLCRRLGEAGIERVAERFSAQRAADDMLAVYRTL